VEKIVLVTSLYRLRKFRACKDRYEHLVERLGPKWGDDDKINLLDILDCNGVDDCLWALRATEKHPDGDRVMRLMAADFAEAVLPIFEKIYPKDDRPRKAIRAARDYANGMITEQECAAAWDAALDAACAAAWAAAGDAALDAARAAAGDAARDAAWAAARAAAGDAAWAAAGDAARDAAVAAGDAARDAAVAAWAAARAAAWAAAGDAAWAAAGDAARDAALCSQAEIIRRYLGR